MDLAGRNILLVEDDDALREALGEILADEGYRVECVANGREALEHLDRSGASPDLILLDLVMPVMDGWTFRNAQRLDPRLARIPTMVLSASFPPDSPRMRSLEAQAVLSKPVSVDRLLQAVERLLPGPVALHASS
jgi:CheY-like chemotaxis protein